MSTNNNDHRITLQAAIDMTSRYRQNQPQTLPLCETFEAEAVHKLLATEGCASLRIYYGMKENMEIHAILVAASASGADILPPANAEATASDEAIIVEDGYRCPPLCPPDSPLNKD